MKMIDVILAELDQEAHATRRVLERVPQAQLSWRPHPRSMSLGQLALHVATVPGNVAELASHDTIPEPPAFVQAEAATSRASRQIGEARLRQGKGLPRCLVLGVARVRGHDEVAAVIAETQKDYQQRSILGVICSAADGESAECCCSPRQADTTKNAPTQRVHGMAPKAGDTRAKPSILNAPQDGWSGS